MDKLYISDHIFPNIKVAITDEEQSVGLMYQKWPPPIMLFPNDNPKVSKFWMKNTPSPLDVIFCKSGKIIGIFYGKPNSTECFGPNDFTDLVIEMPHGFVEEYNITLGNSIRTEYSVDTIVKLYKNSRHK